MAIDRLRIVVAITGASGVAIGVRLLHNLTDHEFLCVQIVDGDHLAVEHCRAVVEERRPRPRGVIGESRQLVNRLSRAGSKGARDVELVAGEDAEAE